MTTLGTGIKNANNTSPVTIAATGSLVLGRGYFAAIGGNVVSSLDANYSGTDSLSNTWTRALTVVNGTSCQLAIFYCPAVSTGGATPTLTFTPANSVGRVEAVADDPNVTLAASPLDTTVSATGNSVSVAPGSSGTLAQASEYAYLAGCFASGSTTSSVNSSFTLQSMEVSTNGATDKRVQSADRTVSATTALAPTITISGAVAWAAGLATFKLVTTTPVTPATRATTWNTLAPVTPATRATTWNVAANVTQTKATTWNVAATVTQTKATTWNTPAPVTPATRATTWNVLSAVTPATRATSWNVRGSVTPATRATTWNTAAGVTAATRATTWNVLGSVTPATRSTTWNVASSLSAVTPATRATTWNVAATVQQTKATTWNVAGQVTAATRATTWNVRAAVTPSSRATTWHVLGAVTPATRATSWNVAGQVTPATRATSWTVLSSVVPGTRATTWHVLAGLTSTRATSWNVKASVAATRSTLWNVASGSTPPSGFPYRAGTPIILWAAGTPTDQPPTGPAWTDHATRTAWYAFAATSRSPV